MADRVTYQLDTNHPAPIATITMDDGKANVMSPGMQAEINAALDRAEADGAVVVLAGRENRFSAGFDLGILQAGTSETLDMLLGGFKLAHRVLSFDTPVVIACTGHAIAMGVFLLLSGDYTVGAEGPYKIVANEVAIGLTMPHTAVEVCRQRLTPAHFNRAVLLSEQYSPETAIAAGFLDAVVAPDQVVATAQAKAAEFAQLNLRAHAASKRRSRGPALAAISAAIEADAADLQAMAASAATT